MHPISDDDRKADNNAILARGNHKSATTHQDKVTKAFNSDVKYGFQIPVPKTILNDIKDSILAPVGMVHQCTINELGGRADKWRLTHDQSFAPPSGNSVNSRLRKEDLAELVYGFCLPRIINYIVETRRRHPDVKILIAKTDCSKAYRRATWEASSASASLCYTTRSPPLLGSPPNIWWKLLSSALDSYFRDHDRSSQ